MERHALDGAHVADILREGKWDVPLADALPRDVTPDDGGGDASCLDVDHKGHEPEAGARA